MRRLLCLALAAGGLAAPRTAGAALQDDGRWAALALADGRRLEYALVVPEGLVGGGGEPGREAPPVLLALPPGGQDRRMVEMGLELYFEAEALRRGWVVVSPAAPLPAPPAAGSPGGEEPRQGLLDEDAALCALVDEVCAAFGVADGSVHLAGVSNGGRTAVRFAGLHPERVRSLTLLPGACTSAADEERLAGLAGIQVRLHAGAEDPDWVAASRTIVSALRAAGAWDVRFEEHAGSGHVLPPEIAPELFDELERARGKRALEALLVELARGGADAAAFREACAPDGRFAVPGADPVDAAGLRAWLLGEGSGGPAPAVELVFLRLSAGGDVAWFELRRGDAAGVGVAERGEDGWRLALWRWSR